MAELREHFARVEKDAWRAAHPFEDSVNQANAQLFATSETALAEQIMNDWLAFHQPCLFGRSAARQGLLSHCILFESDFVRPDAEVRDRIQAARTDWTRLGFHGKKSGFVVSTISPRLANASPASLKPFAKRLCELYLLDEIQFDHVHLDDLFLEAPGYPGRIWRWRAGVNYFAATADGRWWQDHRIPGGIAFSVNSVGHMARSGAIAKLLSNGAVALGLESGDLPASPIDSLTKSLLVAMQTIAGASDAVSGKATSLLPLPPGAPLARRCPAHFPAKLQSFDALEYHGFYHTDYTLPSEYFKPAVTRPADTPEWALDFSYLTDDGIDNPAGITMGRGQRLRAHASRTRSASEPNCDKSRGELIEIADIDRRRISQQ